MKEDHDFNWVKARQDCSLPVQFTHLRYTVEKNTEERRNGLKPGHKEHLEFKAVNDRQFIVVRTAFGSGTVSFDLREDRVVVEMKNHLGELKKRFKLTLTLNDEGECRFKIDGKGEYLRWQVARKALEQIFFHGFFQES